MTWVSLILGGLNDTGCRYVVVGSAARRLLGEPVEPADLDVVVADTDTDHRAAVTALRAFGARVAGRDGWCSLTERTSLPWDWSWSASTSLGPVDVITRFLDGSDYARHGAGAIDVAVPGVGVFPCHPTRWVP